MPVFMMQVLFSQDIPTIQEIQQEIHSRAGLNVELRFVNHDGDDDDVSKAKNLFFEIAHNKFQRKSTIKFCEKEIQVLRDKGKLSYLDWAVILSLSSLGGISKYPVPIYAKKKWSDLNFWEKFIHS